MARNGVAPSSIHNRLLSRLQPKQSDRLRPDLELLGLATAQAQQTRRRLITLGVMANPVYSVSVMSGGRT